MQRLRRDLVRAGLTIKPSQFFLLRVGLALAGFLAAYTLSLSLPFPVRLALLAGGAVGGYRVVKPYLRFMQRRRVAAFEKYFPDALDVMIGALESGASLTTAMELVSREMPPPLSLEFARVLRDAGMGLSYEDAFGNLLDRVPSEDLGMMVSAVSIQFRVGGNLAEVFKTLGHTVRERVRIRGEIKTLTSQQRLTGKVITGLPFLLTGVLFWLNGAYMAHLFDPGLTRVMLVLGLIMVGVGNWVIGRIVAIDV